MSGVNSVGSSSIAAMAQSIQKPTKPADASDEHAMMQYQEDLQAYNRMMSMLSNILQVEHDTDKSVVQNIRV